MKKIKEVAKAENDGPGVSLHSINSTFKEGRVQVYDHLTLSTRDLLQATRNKAREMNFKYVWTSESKILVRRDSNSPAIKIATAADIEKIK